MAEHAPIKPKTLPVISEVSVSEPEALRMMGDSKGWGGQDPNLAPEGDGVWRSQAPLAPGSFLQAMGDWKAEGLSKIDAKIQPERRSQEGLSTGPGAIKPLD